MKRKLENVEPDYESWPEEFRALKTIHRSVCMICGLLEGRTRLAIHIRSAVENQIAKPTLQVVDSNEVDYLCMIKVLLKDEIKYTYSFPIPGEKLDSGELDEENLIFEFVDSKPKKTAAAKQKLLQRRLDWFPRAIQEFLNDNNGGNQPAWGVLKRLALEEIPVSQKAAEEQEIVTPANKSTDNKKIWDGILDYCQSHGMVEGGLIRLPPRQAQYLDDEQKHLNLSSAVIEALKENHISRLYSHQVEAIDSLINHGKSVVVSTPTSSGKSLIYQIPAIEAILKDKDATALYIFPTKALAQDQKRAFNALLEKTPELQGNGDICVDTYDGDTDPAVRERIRNQANVIFTNPDMLHANILPSWDKFWVPFLRNLKLIVVDELHVYSGWFGANVALIMRRLLRICERILGNYNLKFVSCSATVKDPASLMKTLFNLTDNKLTVIDQDGAPSGEKNIAVCKTALVNPNYPQSGRVHPVAEGAQVISELMNRGVRTIAFCKYRRTCELLIKAVRQELKTNGNDELSGQVMSYRGGYSPEDRRKIERDLFDGTLLAIVATNALELGIDIGTLEACVVVGFPFSISNLRQQFGRAGRSNNLTNNNDQSLGVLICGGDPVDQHFSANPQKLVELPDVDIGISLDENILVTEPQVQCAAFESPIDMNEDSEYFQSLDIIKKKLVPLSDNDATKPLLTCDDNYLPWPPKHVSIRGSEEEDEFAVVDVTNNRDIVIETVEASRVSFTLYEGGIFLHQGRPYLVKQVDLDMKLAKVHRVNVNWTTRQRDFTDVDPIETLRIREVDDTVTGGIIAKIGKIRRTTVVFGFFKLDQSNQIIEDVPVEHPPLVQISEGLWIDLPTSLFHFLRSKRLSVAGAIHGACHVFISMSFTVINGGCGMGTECKAPEKEFATSKSERTRPARLIFYDNFGNGICRRAFGFIPEILKRARDRVAACPCSVGCPECIAMEACKEDSLVISKPGSMAILNWLTGSFQEDQIPSGPEENLQGKIHHETVVPVP